MHSINYIHLHYSLCTIYVTLRDSTLKAFKQWRYTHRDIKEKYIKLTIKWNYKKIKNKKEDTTETKNTVEITIVEDNTEQSLNNRGNK